jgi:hypothetical protein
MVKQMHLEQMIRVANRSRYYRFLGMKVREVKDESPELRCHLSKI